ncbi:MAG: nitroreductase family protein [Paludibacteraceae bacterium]
MLTAPLLQRIGSEIPNTRCLNRPACAFVPCGDLSKALDSRTDFWVNDVSAAIENLLLTVHAIGLGAVWTGIHPDPDRVAQLQAILQLPEHHAFRRLPKGELHTLDRVEADLPVIQQIQQLTD